MTRTSPQRVRARGAARLAVLSAALGAIACGDSTAVAPPHDLHVFAATSSAATPVRGTFTGRALSTPASVLGAVRVEMLLAGTISQLGASRARLVLPEVIVDLTNGGLVVGSATWTGLLTAANGDELTGRYTVRESSIPLSLTGDFESVADLEIVSATGRLRGASGTGVSVIRGNVLTGAIRVAFSGEVWRPAAGR